MKDESSPVKDEEDFKIGETVFIVDSYERMLALLEKDYKVEMELGGEMFLMRKKGLPARS